MNRMKGKEKAEMLLDRKREREICYGGGPEAEGKRVFPLEVYQKE